MKIDIIQYFLNVLLTSGLTSIILAGFIFLFRQKIVSYIQYSTKLQFDKKLEDYKDEELKRQKATLIADLISEWISFPKNTKRLNQLTLEAFIWLPKETANKLSQRFVNREDAPDVRELVSDVRVLILGKDQKINSNDIIIFPSERKKTKTKENDKDEI